MQADCLADAGASACLGRGRIHHHQKGRLVHSQRQELAQQSDAVAGRAAAGAVGGVHQQHRSPLHLAAASNRLRHRQMLCLERSAPLPKLRGQRMRLVCRQRGVIVRHHYTAAAHAGQIVVRMDLETGYGEDGRLRFQAPRPPVQVGHRPVPESLAVTGPADNRDLGQGHHRSDVALYSPQQEAGPAFAGGIGVVVRVVGERNQGSGLPDHARGDVRVQVERHDDWQVRPHDAAHGIEEIALRVHLRSRDHGAVHGEYKAVKRRRSAQSRQQRFLQLGVAGIRQRSPRDAARCQQRERLRALLCAGGEDAGNFAVGAGQLQQGIAFMDIGVAKQGQVGLRGRELVAFLEDRADADAHACHRISSLRPFSCRDAQNNLRGNNVTLLPMGAFIQMDREIIPT